MRHVSCLFVNTSTCIPSMLSLSDKVKINHYFCLSSDLNDAY